MEKLSQITRKDEFHRVVDLSGNCDHYIRGENKDAVVDYHDSVQDYYQVEFANLDTWYEFYQQCIAYGIVADPEELPLPEG